MGTKRATHDKLCLLTDILIEDIMSAPDEAILAEIEEDRGIASVMATASADLASVKVHLGKAKLVAARKAVSAERRSRQPRSRVAPAQARKRLSTAFAGSAGGARFTLAARKGDGVPDTDLEGLIEDAADLGINLGEPTEDSSDSG
jgi:hypothetical protein